VKVRQIEKKVTEYLGIRHAVAVNSGISALFVALHALGTGPDGEIIVPGYTFIASIPSILFARGIPVLAE
jgi:dTDP-4-amino-4,6-dideoxygalactose transaminase